MFNLTESPEFMAELRRAMVLAAETIDFGTKVPVDDEDTWLTPKEARAFTRQSESAWKRFKRDHPDMVVSVAVGTSEPRIQLAWLKRMMREGSPQLAAAAPAFRVVAGKRSCDCGARAAVACAQIKLDEVRAALAAAQARRRTHF